MFGNLEQDGDLLGISGCPENTRSLAASLWGILLASRRSLSDAWAMAEECRALLKAIETARASGRDDDMPLLLSAAYAGSAVVEQDGGGVTRLAALLLMIIEAVPDCVGAMAGELKNGGVDIDNRNVRPHLEPAPAWLTLSASLLPVTVSEMLAAYGLGLVDDAVTALQKWNPAQAVEYVAQAGYCFGQAGFDAGDAYKSEIQRKRAAARAALGGKAKHAQSPEAKQKAAILAHWRENPPTGLSAEKAAFAVVDKTIGGVEITLANRTVADLLRSERKAGRLLK